jgi:two-component system, NarL family, invasion response regulator UvrY
VVREGLRFVLTRDSNLQVIGEVGDGDAVVELCEKRSPDVVLLDVSMPGPGVLEVTRQLKEHNPALRILVLSVHPEQHYAKRALQAGADGYLTKTHSSQELIRAIYQVQSGRKYITPVLAQELAVDVAMGRERAPHEGLSNREYEVLLKLGEGKPIPLIAKLMNISPKTVRTYRGRILEKMNLKNTAQLIFYTIHNGLITGVLHPELQLTSEVGEGQVRPVNATVRRGKRGASPKATTNERHRMASVARG